MNKTTVDLSNPTFYAEPDNYFYRLKRRITYRNILKITNNYISNTNNQSVLEIGTGSGFLTSFLEKKYPYITIYGIEYDERLVELTKSKINNCKIVQGNAENFDLKLKFNLIVSLQVIEHLYNPVDMIKSVRNHLAEDGVFLFTTPNLGCVSNKVMKTKWHGYRIDHVSLKSRENWDDLLTKEGFDKIYSGSTFFSGIPVFNKLPFGIINWLLLYFIGSLPWSKGESYVGVFRKSNK
jgi:SAM-dependent methyltransferase